MVERNRLSSYFFFLLLLFFLYEAARLLMPFFGPILCALAAAIVCYPLHVWIGRKWIKNHPALQAGVSDLAVLLFIVLPITFVGISVVNEVHNVLPQVRTGLETRVRTMSQNPLIKPSWIAKLPPSVAERLDVNAVDLQDHLTSFANFVVSHLAEIAAGLARNVVEFLLQLILFLFVLFFLFRDGEKLYHQWNDLIPLSQGLKTRVHQRLQSTVQGVVRGTIIVGLAQAFCLLIGYLSVRAGAAILLACLSAFASLVPGVGTALVWVPISGYYFLQGSVGKGVTIVLFGFATGVVDNILRPIVMGGQTEISVLWLMLGVMGGLEVFGVKGLLLGPLVFAILPILLDIYRSYILDSRRSS